MTAEAVSERAPLIRSLPDDALAIRRAAFSALRNHERLSADEVTRRTGCDEQSIRTALHWLDDAGLVEWDVRDRIVGMAGLTLEPTNHRLVLDGETFHTWCTIDAIGIPAAFSINAAVTTTCAHCGALIEVDIENGGPPSNSPLRGWLPPTECANVRADLCPLANLFCDEDHLERWRAEAHNPSGESVDLARFAELGRQAWGDLAEENEHV